MRILADNSSNGSQRGQTSCLAHPLAKLADRFSAGSTSIPLRFARMAAQYNRKVLHLELQTPLCRYARSFCSGSGLDHQEKLGTSLPITDGTFSTKKVSLRTTPRNLNFFILTTLTIPATVALHAALSHNQHAAASGANRCAA